MINEPGGPPRAKNTSHLGQLGDKGALEMLEAAIGSGRVLDEREPSRELIRSCKHEPLALQLAGSALASRPSWKLALAMNLVSRRPADSLSAGLRETAEPLDATYQLLTEDEQYALRCVGAIGTARFASWALQAALGDEEGDEARALAAQLTRTGLIERTSTGTGGAPLYEVPESVVVFARKFIGQPDMQDALTRLRDHQAGRSQVKPHFWIRKQVYPCMREGQLSEAVERARDALNLVMEYPDEGEEAACFAALAEVYAELGEMSAAEDAAEYTLSIDDPDGNTADSKARAHRTLAKLRRRAHQLARAERNLDMGLALAREIRDTGEEIRILAERAVALSRCGEFSQALRDIAQAHDLCTAGELRQLPFVLWAYGSVHFYRAEAAERPAVRQENLAAAEQRLDDGYRIADSAVGGPPRQLLWMGWIRHAQAKVAIGKSERDRAIKFANDAMAIFAEKRHRYGVAHCRILLGSISLREGQPADAAGELMSALETFHNCGDAWVEADASLLLAEAFLQLGKTRRAYRLQRAASNGYLQLRDVPAARAAATAAVMSGVRWFLPRSTAPRLASRD